MGKSEKKDIKKHRNSNSTLFTVMMKPTNLFLPGNCFGIGEHKKGTFR